MSATAVIFGFLSVAMVIFARISVLLKTKDDGAFEVDMSVRDRGDVAHMAFGAAPIRAFGGPLLLIRFSGDDDTKPLI